MSLAFQASPAPGPVLLLKFSVRCKTMEPSWNLWRAMCLFSILSPCSAAVLLHVKHSSDTVMPPDIHLCRETHPFWNTLNLYVPPGEPLNVIWVFQGPPLPSFTKQLPFSKIISEWEETFIPWQTYGKYFSHTRGLLDRSQGTNKDKSVLIVKLFNFS